MDINMDPDIQIVVGTVQTGRFVIVSSYRVYYLWCHLEFLDTQSSPFIPKFHRIVFPFALLPLNVV